MASLSSSDDVKAPVVEYPAKKKRNLMSLLEDIIKSTQSDSSSSTASDPAQKRRGGSRIQKGSVSISCYGTK